MTETIAIYNAHIYADWHCVPFQAALIKNGLIQFLGSNAEIKAIASSNACEYDFNGMTVWPGLCDAHIHLEQLGDQLAAINCDGLSKQEIINAVRLRCEKAQPGEWIIGFGFNQHDWQPPEYGNAHELDLVSPNNPVLIHAKSLHAAWANSFALRLGNIHHTSPDPQGGSMLRFEDGSPNGILLENAISKVTDIIPKTAPDQLARNMLKTQTYLHSLGITSAHDFDDLAMAQALLDLNNEDSLRLRVMKNVRFVSLDRIIQEDWHDRLNVGSFLRAGWLKLFADGALGSQSAAMLEPYENSQNCGMLLMNQNDMVAIGKRAVENKWPLTIHAIGDRAVRECLKTMKTLQDYCDQKQIADLPPHRIEHIQALDPLDLPVFSKQGVIASVQPVHATSDYLVASKYWGNRCETAYAYHSLLNSGAVLLFGTDAPVELPTPFHTLHAVITRQTLQGEPKPDGWYPQQRLSMRDALEAMTINPARYFRSAAQTGTLRPGSYADFIVLREDPMALPANVLPFILPEMTFVSGELVFSRF